MNPFAALGAPPPSDDQRGQAEWLHKCAIALAAQNDPRGRVLRDKLGSVLADMGPGQTPEQAQATNARLTALQIETFELMGLVIKQVRVTLRAKLGRGMAKNTRVDTERLQQELAGFARALRKVVAAMKTGDEQKRREAHAMLDGLMGLGKHLQTVQDDQAVPDDE